MDVTLPDGTVINSVPEGITKAMLTEKLRLNGYDISKLDSQSQPTTQEAILTNKAATGARGIYNGLTGLAGLPVDTAENVANLARAGYGTLMATIGKPELSPKPLTGSFGGTESIRKGIKNIGINTDNINPEDSTSRMLHTGGTLLGSSVFPGARLAPALASATSGAIAGEALGPKWVGVGAMAPAMAGIAGGAIKSNLTSKSNENIEAFRSIGAEPSVGQATENVFIHGIENLVSKFPGGSGVMQKFIQAQQKSIGASLKTGTPAETAGRAIESGISGQGGFIERTKDIWKNLDNAVAAKIPPNAKFVPTNTVNTLDELTRPIAGAESTTGALINPKIAQMKSNFNADLQANNGEIPFDALRALRTKVGSMIDDSLVSGVSGGEAKKLYGALSKDLEASAYQAGAGKEFARQNQYYKARMGRIDNVLNRVIGQGNQPEQIFKNINPTDPDQANKLRAVMRSLEPSERQVVSDAVVNRLGKTNPSNQNEVGELFSSEKFLTNWNKLSTGAKAQLFPDLNMHRNLDNIAKVASELRMGKGIYSNPSGTAGSFAAYSVYMSPLAAVASGSVAPLAAAGMAAGGANISARMLTNPKIVDWLAKPVNPIKGADATAHLGRLMVIFNQSKDPALKEDLSNYIQSIQQGKK